MVEQGTTSTPIPDPGFTTPSSSYNPTHVGRTRPRSSSLSAIRLSCGTCVDEHQNLTGGEKGSKKGGPRK